MQGGKLMAMTNAQRRREAFSGSAYLKQSWKEIIKAESCDL